MVNLKGLLNLYSAQILDDDEIMSIPNKVKKIVILNIIFLFILNYMKKRSYLLTSL